jgi:hypothetical protein
MRKQYNRFLKSFGILTLAVCCGFAAAPAFAAAEFPAGTFTAGAFTITFGAGKFRLNQGDVMEVEGGYSAKGSQIQLIDKSGPWACTKAGEQTGTYDWKYENGTLAFSKVADKCDDRSQSLTGQPWKKK